MNTLNIAVFQYGCYEHAYLKILVLISSKTFPDPAVFIRVFHCSPRQTQTDRDRQTSTQTVIQKCSKIKRTKAVSNKFSLFISCSINFSDRGTDDRSVGFPKITEIIEIYHEALGN